jgi:3-oxoacyl-[acyl-carrier-protein] synthase III
MEDVYITRIAKYLPNEPVSNDEMEGILGMVNGEPSRARLLVLGQNGIDTRYYVHNKRGEPTHNNAQLTAAAIHNLTDEEFTLNDVELLCCGTTTPDQLMPSHAAMVHGVLNNRPMEIVSPHGVCCSGMQACKFGFLSVKAGNTTNAVCTGSETSSYYLNANHFQQEVEALEALKKRPVLAFEKEFLRWMLSDGAGAILMENRPRGEKSLRIEWIDIISFANELDVCMSAACHKDADGGVRNWKSYELADHPTLSALKQDISILSKHAVNYGVKALQTVVQRRSLDLEKVDYYLPHLSSFYFRNALFQAMETAGLGIPAEKWFINLKHVGNVGSASIYLALEELFNMRELKKGQQILLGVPESARFTYAHALLTVC